MKVPFRQSAKEILFSQASFWAPLRDKGNGEVDLNLARGSGSATFTRATIATCRLSSGLLKQVASGVPRSHYLSDGTYAGYLEEGARTNLCLQSEDLATSWGNTGTPVVTTNTDVAPDGTTTADTIEDNDAAAFEGCSQTFVVANDSLDHVFSVFVKKTSGGTAKIVGVNMGLSGGAPAVTNHLRLNTDDGTQEFGTANQTVEDWGTYWRVVGKITNNSTGNTSLQIVLFPAVASQGDSSDQSSVTGTAVFWGAQLEKASFASSYIPTTTAAVTRNVDVLTYPFAGNALAASGWSYAEVANFNGTDSTFGGTTGYVLAFGAEAPQGIGAGSVQTAYICRDGTTVVSKSGLNSCFGTVRKRANTWGGSTQLVTGDGLTPQSGAFDGDAGSTGIGIGCTPAGTNQWFGTVKNLRIGQVQLSSSVLSMITV